MVCVSGPNSPGLGQGQMTKFCKHCTEFYEQIKSGRIL
jgi:hypothetical protein